MTTKLESAITQAYDLYHYVQEGEPASYLDALAHTDPNHFGIAAMDMEGTLYEIGDTRIQFSIQSISKVFTLLLAFAEYGLDGVYARVGAEPSGDLYNSLHLMPNGKPFSPMVNAGAIAVCGMLAEKLGSEAKDIATDWMSKISDGLLTENEQVREIEERSGDRNMAIAYLLKSNGLIADVDKAIDLYNWCCALETDAQDLASMAACLASAGVHPRSKETLLDPHHVQHALSIMASCGMYSYSGSWFTDVGMPAKSGVSGGLIGAVVGRFGLGVYSPLLDSHGNSVRAISVSNYLDDQLDIHCILSLR